MLLQTNGRTERHYDANGVLCDHASLPENVLGTVSGTKCKYISLRTKKGTMVMSKQLVIVATHTAAVWPAPQCSCDMFVERVTTETEEFHTSEGTHCHVLRNHFPNVLLLES